MPDIYQIRGHVQNVFGVIDKNNLNAPNTDNLLRQNIPVGEVAINQFIASVLKEITLVGVFHEEDEVFFRPQEVVGDNCNLIRHIMHGHLATIPVYDNVQQHNAHWVAEGIIIADGTITALMQYIVRYILNVDLIQQVPIYNGQALFLSDVNLQTISIVFPFLSADFTNTITSNIYPSAHQRYLGNFIRLLGRQRIEDPVNLGDVRAIQQITIYLTKNANSLVFRINSIFPEFQYF
jgi:hypothetical protein